MGLVVLKNQGYQEYQNALAQGMEAQQQHALSGDTEKGAEAQRDRKEGSSRVQRYVLLLVVFGVMTALSTTTTIVLYRYGTASTAHASQAASAANDYTDAGDAAAAHDKLWAEQRSLWRCKDGRYTNTPAANDACEYVGASESEGGERFITPGAPRF